MCSAAKINWPMNNRSVYGFSEMTTIHDSVNDVLWEDRRMQMCPDCPCVVLGDYLQTAQTWATAGVVLL